MSCLSSLDGFEIGKFLGINSIEIKYGKVFLSVLMWPVDVFYKWPVIWKAFWCHHVLIIHINYQHHGKLRKIYANIYTDICSIDYISMLGSKLIYVSKRNSCAKVITWTNTDQSHWWFIISIRSFMSCGLLDAISFCLMNFAKFIQVWIHIFLSMNKICCVKLKFHDKYLAHTLKEMIFVKSLKS